MQDMVHTTCCMCNSKLGMHSSGFCCVLHSCTQPLLPLPCRAGPLVAAAASAAGQRSCLPSTQCLPLMRLPCSGRRLCAPCEMCAVLLHQLCPLRLDTAALAAHSCPHGASLMSLQGPLWGMGNPHAGPSPVPAAPLPHHPQARHLQQGAVRPGSLAILLSGIGERLALQIRCLSTLAAV